MLLKVIEQANKFSSGSGITLPISKQVEKSSTPTENM